MNGANDPMILQNPTMEEKLRDRLETIRKVAPESIGALMQYRLQECNDAQREYTFLCDTYDWMRNIPGTLHGGICATVLDQAMGFVAYCLKTGEGTAPTVQLSVDYHRPLTPGEAVLVKVKVISQSRSLMRLSAEAYPASSPARVCLTGTATYFNRHP